MSKIDLDTVRQANSLIQDDDSFLRKYVRPIGELLAYILINIGIKPTTISYINLIITSVGISCLFIHTQNFIVLSLLFMVMFQLLDTTDGTMARSLEINSRLGRLMDDFTGLLFLSFYQMGIAYNVYSFPDYSLSDILNNFGVESLNYSNIILIMGAFSAILALSSRSALQMREKRYKIKLYDKNKTVKKRFIKPLHILRLLERPGGFYIILCLISYFINILELFVLFMFILEIIIFTGVYLSVVIPPDKKFINS